MQLQGDIDAEWFATILEEELDEKVFDDDSRNYHVTMIRDGRWIHVLLKDDDEDLITRLLVTVVPVVNP
jgi:hypothetical protein